MRQDKNRKLLLKRLLGISLALSMASYLMAQVPNATRITYNSFGMSSELNIAISENTIEISKRAFTISDSCRSGLKKKEWKRLKRAIHRINLDSLPYYEAPTNVRATDAASYCTITIQHNNQSYRSMYYDGGKPNHNLQELDSLIQQTSKTYDTINWDKLYAKAKLDAERSIEDEIFQLVEVMPNHVDGATGLQNFININLTNPDQSIVSGVAYAKFVVEKNGRITNKQVIKAESDSIKKAAEAILSKMPNWVPGQQRGKAVRVLIVIPIQYKE